MKKRMIRSEKWKRILGSILFVCLFVCVFHQVTAVLSRKAGVNDTVRSFYDCPKDSLDVLFVGSSHSYRAFSPMEIWKEKGIASYNLATASQTIPSSYFLIKEGIRTQHPDVIVLEAYGSWYPVDYVSPELLHGAVDGMPLNATKIEFLTTFLSKSMNWKECMNYALPIITYHGRWQELKQKDFVPKRTFLKGYQYTEKTEELEKPGLVTDTEEVYETTMVYFDKIIELCEKEGVKLVVALTPSAKSERYEEISRRANTFMEYAAQRGAACVDFQELVDEVGIDFAADFYNPDHLNAFGGDKISRYMADYLAEEYRLADHRGEPEYASWDKDYEEYRAFRGSAEDKTADDGM